MLDHQSNESFQLIRGKVEEKEIGIRKRSTKEKFVGWLLGFKVSQ